MFGIFVHYSTRPIYDVSMNLFCWPPSVDIFNILPGFLWQPLCDKLSQIDNKSWTCCLCFFSQNGLHNKLNSQLSLSPWKWQNWTTVSQSFTYQSESKTEVITRRQVCCLSCRAALDRYLRSPPINKKFSICDTIQFNEANKALNSYLKHLASTGKIAGTVHKNPLTAEVVQKLF